MEGPNDAPLPPTMTPPPGMMGEVSPWARVMERLRELTRGEYEIQRELGRGGMAAVFLAHDLALDRRVAIKVMSPALLSGEGMVARFHREAVTVAKLDHPNIITIHAVRQREELHFLVLKFVEGRSLESILHTAGPLPIPIARALLHQVGQALGYAHRRGVVHRDVKPGNILVDVDGNAIVTDFGIAKVAESTTQTQTGAIVGTPVYISPEQCFAETATGFSDQYALGIVAFEMLTGRPPFTGTSFVIMQAHVDTPAPSIRELRPDVPPELEAAIMRMLAKRPEDRWPTMSQALAAMEAKPLAELSPERDRLIGMATPDGSMQAIPAPATPPPVSRSAVTSSASITSIELVSPSAKLEVGDRARLEAIARDESGAIVAPGPVRWAVDPAALAAIDELGTLTSLAPGMVTVTAATTSVRTQATISITPPRVASVTVTPPPGVLRAGTQLQLTATAYDRRKAPMRRGAIWELLEGRATVNSDGVLVAESGGPVRVAAEVEGVRGELQLTIVDARIVELRIGGADRVRVGEYAPFSVDALDERGRRVTVSDERPPVWSSSDPDIAEITADGRLTARSPGTATVSVEWQGRTATMDVGIVPITAAVPTMAGAGAAVGADAGSAAPPSRGGRRMPLLAGVAVVAVAGVAAAVAMMNRGGDAPPAVTVGQQAGTAAAGGATASAAASIAAPAAAPVESVAPVVIARVRFTPASLRPLTVGDKRKLAATPFDSAGAAIAGLATRWSSGDSLVARVDSTGAVTAVGPGATWITAQVVDRRERVRVTVRAPLPSEDSVRVLVEEYLALVRARDRARIESFASAAGANRQDDARALGELVRSYGRIETTGLIIAPPRADGDAAVASFTVELRGRATMRRDITRSMTGEVRLERRGTGWAIAAAYPTSGVR